MCRKFAAAVSPPHPNCLTFVLAYLLIILKLCVEERESFFTNNMRLKMSKICCFYLLQFVIFGGSKSKRFMVGGNYSAEKGKESALGTILL